MDINNLQQVRIIENLPLSECSGIIRFERFFAFKAGQVVSLTYGNSIPPRMYSIASSETDERVDILYKTVLHGKLTPVLSQLRKGDLLKVSQPFGKFLATDGPAVFIATGTGIAPFLSMIRSGNSAHKTLIHGNRNQADFYYADYLRNILRERYIACCSGPENAGSFPGRITQYLQQAGTVQSDIKYYLCGSAEMIVDVRQLLIDREVPFQHILSEIYF